MQRISLGNTGLEVSPICYGGWQASGWESSNETSFKTVLSTALGMGINFMDTAPAYGKGLSESLIGEVLKGRDRDSYVIASKFNHYESQPKRVRLSVERSLQRLNCGHIDLLQQHWPIKKPAFEKTLEELLLMKEEGLIRAIGVCNWLQPEFEKIEPDTLSHIDTLQPCYSLLWRQVESLKDFCIENSIAMLPYSPLAQGLLALGTVPHKKFQDHRGSNVLFGERYRSQVEEVLKTVRSIATAHGATPAQVALRWLLDRDEVASVITGASSVSQLEDNIGALQLSLSADAIEELNLVSSFFSNAFEPHDTMWDWHSLK